MWQRDLNRCKSHVRGHVTTVVCVFASFFLKSTISCLVLLTLSSSLFFVHHSARFPRHMFSVFAVFLYLVVFFVCAARSCVWSWFLFFVVFLYLVVFSIFGCVFSLQRFCIWLCFLFLVVFLCWVYFLYLALFSPFAAFLYLVVFFCFLYLVLFSVFTASLLFIILDLVPGSDLVLRGLSQDTWLSLSCCSAFIWLFPACPLTLYGWTDPLEGMGGGDDGSTSCTWLEVAYLGPCKPQWAVPASSGPR